MICHVSETRRLQATLLSDGSKKIRPTGKTWRPLEAGLVM